MIYIVLGMHKSGTTLASRLLHKSGINMVESFDQKVGYYQGNKMERTSTFNINQNILNSKDIHSLNIPVRKKLTFTTKDRKDMSQAIEQCQRDYSDWGFKDPRTCLTYPLWKQVLPKHKVIIVFRHPVQVMEHYKHSIRLGRLKAYFSWVEHNNLLLKIIETLDNPYMVLNYDDLMNNEQVFEQLETFISRPIIDVRKKSNYNNQSTKSFRFSVLSLLTNNRAVKVYHCLQEESEVSLDKMGANM